MKSLGLATLAFVSIAAVSGGAHADDTWLEQKTTADDGTANAQFGSAAALEGTTALIGADGASGARGAAYFFQNIDGVWTQGQEITADDGHGSDEFGYRVALRDGLAIVTSFSASVDNETARGAAYLFALDGGSWSQTQKLVTDDGVAFDNFGSSIAIDGTTLVIGANGATVGANPAQGAAYIFTSSGGTWSQVQKVIADDGIAFDNFGIAAALAGDNLFVSAPTTPIGGNPGQGAVYAYHFDGSQWAQTQKLLADDGGSFDMFGLSLAFDGTTLLVGATGSGGGGAVYAFGESGGSWVQQQRIVSDDRGSGDSFGNAISLRDSRALIGADISTVDNDTSRGAAYLFSLANGEWTQQHKFISSDGTTDDFFGLAVALDGDTALISTLHPTIGNNMNQGAAYFYTDDTVFADGFDG